MVDENRIAQSRQAWQELLGAIADAGATVAAVEDEVDVAEGFRYVLDVLGDRLDRAATSRSARPLFLPGVTPVRKLFFDNPDTDYDVAHIDGGRSYRIRGHRGTATYLAFCVYAGNPAQGQQTRVANLADPDIDFAPDGTFELTLSPSLPAGAGNRIELAPDAHAVIARQYFLDRAVERPARFEIEALDGAGPDAVFDSDGFVRLAGDTAAFVRAATAIAHRRAADAGAAPNQFTEIAGHGVYGTPDAGYVVCWYELADSEALVIDFEPPRCRYWGVHLANRWGQSLDHRTRRTVLNTGTTVTGADGRHRVVVAHRDPRTVNWLDTAGHRHGWVLFRWLLADDVATPRARVVELDAPGGHTA